MFVSNVLVASSVTSITDSTVSLDVITVALNLTKGSFLGISIYGQCYSNGDNGIYVGSIMDRGVVQQDGRINVGDMILQVPILSNNRIYCYY